MVDFNDLASAKVTPAFLALLKFWHILDGIYIWEFFTTLDYEWRVFQGRQRYLWTVWVYSVTRVATLVVVILLMMGYDVTSPINCQAWVTSVLVLSGFACGSASLLIVIRTIAIWNRNRMIFMIATGVWLTDVAFFIYNTVKLRSSWAPAENTCDVVNSDSSKPPLLSYLITDVILLLIMLLGLSRLRYEGGMFGLGRLLWKQGIIWLLLATVAEVPQTVFIFLNLNESFNLMFQAPYMIIISIAATRMYRSLTTYNSSDFSEACPISHTALRVKPISTDASQLNRMEVVVHTHSERTCT